MNSNHFEAVLFDFDDTLVDYAASQRYGLEETFLRFGIPPEEKYFTIYKEENDRLWRLIEKGEIHTDYLRVRRFEVLLERAGMGGKYSPEELCDVYLENFSKSVDLEPGASDVLSRIAGREDLKKAIITNGFKETQRARLKVAELDGFFDGVFISDEIGYKKPSPEIFQFSLYALEVSIPERTLVVGDNIISDIMGGKKAGLATCWYNPRGETADPEYAGYADHEIRSLTELIPLLSL